MPEDAYNSGACNPGLWALARRQCECFLTCIMLGFPRQVPPRQRGKNQLWSDEGDDATGMRAALAKCVIKGRERKECLIQASSVNRMIHVSELQRK